jgi:hypothetical protein
MALPLSRFPSSRERRIALVLLPFKAYVVVVIPFYFVFRAFCPEPSHPTGSADGTGFMLLNGLIASGLVLLLGAGVQWFACGRRAARQTLMFAAAPVLVWLLILLTIHG